MKQKGVRFGSWQAGILVFAIVAIGLSVALLQRDVRLGPDEEVPVPEGELIPFDESELYSISGKDYDGALIADFGDSYSQEDAEEWEAYYESCTSNSEPANDGSAVSSSGSYMDARSTSSCESPASCTETSTIPIEKEYSNTTKISGASDAQLIIKGLFSRAAGERATLAATFDCNPHDSCKRTDTIARYTLNIEPITEGVCTSTWTHTYSTSFSGRGSESLCASSLQSQMSAWTYSILQNLKGNNDPCPSCSFYTVTSLPVSYPSVDTCSAPALFKVTCGPQRSGVLSSKYKFTLSVSYTFTCRPTPPS